MRRDEAAYQVKLIEKLNDLFPGCHIIRNDPRVTQGVPDILILIGSHWAMLELKRTTTASRRPNQDHYVEHFDEMSFAAFICPENEEQVLHDLQSTLGACR